MGIFDFLTKKEPNKKDRKVDVDILLPTIHTDLKDLSKRKFATIYKNTAGYAIYSQNGEYQLYWYTDKHKGYVSLFKNKVKICEVICISPNDCAVANNGTFIVSDWLNPDDLKGTFYAYTCEGKLLVKAPFDANLGCTGLSPDGRYAVCQTANSPSKKDSSILTAFDLVKKKILFKITNPKKTWGAQYEFDLDNRYVHLYHFGDYRITYNLMNGDTVPRNNK